MLKSTRNLSLGFLLSSSCTKLSTSTSYHKLFIQLPQISFSLIRREASSVIGCQTFLLSNQQAKKSNQLFVQQMSLLSTNASTKLPSNMRFRASLSSSKSEPRKLILLFAWMLAKDAHLDKYRNLWNSRGYDILTVQTAPIDLLFPPPGSRRNFNALINFLSTQSQPYERILYHTFSVGTFVSVDVFSRFTNAHTKGREDEANHLIKSLQGIIMDSITFPNESSVGLAKSVTDNPISQFLIRSTAKAYQQLTRPITLDHYDRIGKVLYDNPNKWHGLFLFSKDDPISSADRTFQLIKQWKSKGIQVQAKCWDKSPHILHYKEHPVEYEKQIDQFLAKLVESKNL